LKGFNNEQKNIAQDVSQNPLFTLVKQAI